MLKILTNSKNTYVDLFNAYVFLEKVIAICTFKNWLIYYLTFKNK
jgi:hypothetical protein